MKLLILGGTAFVGRFLAEAALGRGHEVTLFNRGQTHPEWFAGVEKLRGDRDGDLAALKNKDWDAVVDTCGYVSRQVRATAELLADHVGHYTFISSVSVYSDHRVPEQNESAPIETLASGDEDARDMSTYGARKVLCEQAAEQAMPGRVLSLRAGMIVGPHDYIDRFPYWVRRVARGGEVLAPGRPDCLIQLIDVRDLAHWNLQMAETNRTGVFNVTGPDRPLTMEQILKTCRTETGSDARFTWVAEPFLLRNEVAPWSELPFWLPENDHAGFFQRDCRKARNAGLLFRPLAQTVRDTFAWDRARPQGAHAPERATVAAQGSIGLQSDREQALLRAWREQGTT